MGAVHSAGQAERDSDESEAGKPAGAERQLQQLSYARMLILDEIGYLPMNREEASLFFWQLNRRYEKASIILMSSIRIP